MSGPREILRLGAVLDDGTVLDFGHVAAELEPMRGHRGLIAADGHFGPGGYDALSAEGVERFRAFAPTAWRVELASGEVELLAYTLESFAFTARTFSLLLTREPDTSPMFAHPKSGDDESESSDGDDR